MSVYVLLITLVFSCNQEETVIEDPNTMDQRFAEEEQEAFQRIQLQKPYEYNLPISELEALANAMTEVRTSVVRVKGNSNLEKFYKLKAEDARLVYKLIRHKDAAASAEARESGDDLESIVDELEEASAAKYGRSFFQLTREQSDDIVSNSSNARKNSGKTRTAEVCPEESFPKVYTEYFSFSYYMANSVSLTSNSWTDLLTGCDYKVTYTNKTGSHCGALSDRMLDAIYSFGGKVSGRGGSTTRFIVGRRVNVYGIGSTTLKNELVLVQ